MVVLQWETNAKRGVVCGVCANRYNAITPRGNAGSGRCLKVVTPAAKAYGGGKEPEAVNRHRYANRNVAVRGRRRQAWCAAGKLRRCGV